MWSDDTIACLGGRPGRFTCVVAVAFDTPPFALHMSIFEGPRLGRFACTASCGMMIFFPVGPLLARVLDRGHGVDFSCWAAVVAAAAAVKTKIAAAARLVPSCCQRSTTCAIFLWFYLAAIRLSSVRHLAGGFCKQGWSAYFLSVTACFSSM